MLNLIKYNNNKVAKPASKIIINKIKKLNQKNIHLLSNSNFKLNCKLPTITFNKYSTPSFLITPNILNFNRSMSSNIPNVFPKETIIDNEEKIELIRNKKVKMARPFHWEEMKYIVEKNSVDVMVRTPADEIVYLNWMKVVKTKYASINDFIKITVMGYSEIVDEKGLKKADKPKSKIDKLIFESEDVYYVIRRNDFPYWVEPNIEHFVLWTSKEFSREHAGKIVHEKFPESDIIYFSNTPDKKSVKGVCHYQIFTRRRSAIKLNEQKLNDLKSKNFKMN